MSDAAPRMVSASEFSDAELAALFTRGYEGYYTPVSLDAAAFRGSAIANDFDLAASRVVLASELPVAFAMLGVRESRGWIGGMGVVAEARGRRLGRAVMMAVLDEARKRHLAHVDLEVLEQNTPAIPIYEALGFRDRRMVDVWSRSPASLPAQVGDLPNVEEATVGECLDRYVASHRTRSPWQRDLPSLRHWQDRLSARVVRGPTGFLAWVLYRVDGQRLNVADATLAEHGAPSALDAVLRSIVASNPEQTLMLVNLPTNEPAGAALGRLGAVVKLRQREMTLAFDASWSSS